MSRKTAETHEYISNHLAVACTRFDQSVYDGECFKELMQLAMTTDFQKNFNYAIYCDDVQVKANVFIPQFHTYFLVSDTKDVILLDKGLIDIPEVYNHHRYYIYNNEELFEECKAKGYNVTNIKSIKDIFNVQTA